MFNKMAPDKWKHFLLGIPLGAGLMLIGLFILPGEYVLVTSVSVILLTVICYGFELFSLVTGKGHYEMLDAIVGIIGGLIGIGAAWMFL